jgi:hypothetical protein
MKRASLKNRVLSWIAAGALCVTTVSISLTSCQLVRGDGTPGQDVSSAQKDAYDAKILYYQTQVQSLTSQLGEMEQQFYVLRDEYMDQLKKLEEQLAAQQKPADPPSEPETSPEQVAPPEQETPPPSEDAGDVQLCEYTYRLEGKFAILTAYFGSDRDVIVPAAVDGYLVIGLGDSVFADCDIRSVTLPKTLERMGWFTFYQCKNLEKVVLPEGLSNIGYASFDGCSRALCLYVVDGSYAEQYAISFGIPYHTQT